MYPDMQNSNGPSRGDAIARQRNVEGLGSSTGTGPRANIPGLLDEQNGSIVGLHKMLNELESRLSQVLAHDVPTPTDAANRLDPPPPTQITDRLVMHNRGIDFAQQRIG